MVIILTCVTMLDKLLNCRAIIDALDALNEVIVVGNFTMGTRPSLVIMLSTGGMIGPLTETIVDKLTGGIRADSLAGVCTIVAVAITFRCWPIGILGCRALQAWMPSYHVC